MFTAPAIQHYFTSIEEDLIRWRRHLHAHPELSFHEVETAAYIAEQARSLGLEPRTGVGGNGVVIDLGTSRTDKPPIALRADIDALPITEKTELPYASRNEGVMHACGHDIHTTSLLGAMRFLAEHSGDLPGSIRLIFQPAEEKLPGGAQAMIADGVLLDPAPAAVLGQHINPDLPVGSAGVVAGQFMASVDDFHVTVTGKGGHAAHPEELVDPVVIAAHIITALQTIVSRNAPRGVATALSIGKVEAHGASNIIPDSARMDGTFRTFDEEWRSRARELIEHVATGVARSFGGDVHLQIEHGYPSLMNNPTLAERIRGYAVEYLGRDKVVNLPQTMGAEDFAYYAQAVPGCFYNLGVTDYAVEPAPPPLHSPRLAPSEESLTVGAGLLTWLALRTLQDA
ncbi:MAG: M20 metallopeptidase family protein [Spirochaetota bacterium]